MMGEHTDYNDGLVCPMALEMACYIALAPASDGKFSVYSANLKEEYQFPADSLASLKATGRWTDYVIGVVVELIRYGIPVGPSRVYVYSDVPGGAGLSSSASLEVATAFALLGGRKMDKLEIARLCRSAEVNFVGMPCGIMDQYASVFGERDSAIQIDCRTLEYEAVHLPQDLRVVVVNSMVKHELGSSAYRQRVSECQEAVDAIRKHDPTVCSLRDVSMELLFKVKKSIPETPWKRARHVVSDNARVLEFATAARESNLAKMGQLFLASHQSARDDYEISCEELDFLVESSMTIPGVYGARMTGGGFGGCTVNLIAPNAVSGYKEQLTAKYKEWFNITPLFYECVPAPGAGPLA
jgi:galactokinase